MASDSILTGLIIPSALHNRESIASREEAEVEAACTVPRLELLAMS